YMNSIIERNLILSSPDIGHQGFSVYEDEKRGIHVLTSAMNDAYHASYFYFHNEKPESKKSIKFFDSSFYSVNEIMPTISSDQKYLIVRGRLSSRRMIFRIYDFNIVKEEVRHSGEQVDLSSKYQYQWEMPASNLVDADGGLRPLQAIASDGNLIYLLLGNAKISDKAIFAYDLSGNLINYNVKVNIGKNSALSDGNGYFYEPEGLALSSDEKCLLILIVTGNGGSHFNRIFIIDKEKLK
ncbi:phage baseplate protein, partial [Yersinia mollaretii]|uniref:phage baseplate protein n=1 Tax=Yersinia mollaretii TaxID=33060 RepID=UPI001643C3EF